MTQEKTILLTLYIGFLLSLIGNFIPLIFVQQIAGLIFIVTILAIYILKIRADKASLTYSHTAYLIKTFWISSLFFTIGLVLCFLFGDHTAIHNTVDAMVDQGAAFTEAELQSILISYGLDNLLIFSLCLAPSMLYFSYRLINGGMDVAQNKKISTPQNWF